MKNPEEKKDTAPKVISQCGSCLDVVISVPRGKRRLYSQKSICLFGDAVYKQECENCRIKRQKNATTPTNPSGV